MAAGGGGAEREEAVVGAADDDVLEEEEDEVEEEEPVELGFCATPDAAEGPVLAPGRRDWAEWDAGKVGGRVVWLDWEKVPSVEAGTCKHCGRALRLLVQVYAPAEAVEASAFHRMVYVLGCMRGACVQSGEGLVVLRGQLPRANRWLPSVSGGEMVGDGGGGVSGEAELCVLTGLRAGVSGELDAAEGSLRASTRGLRYATAFEAEQHGRHVSAGLRKAAAALGALPEPRTVPIAAPRADVAASNGWVWPEWDLVIESEPGPAERRKALAERDAEALAGLMKHVKVVDGSGMGGGEGEVGASDSSGDKSAEEGMAGFESLSQRELDQALGVVPGADDTCMRAFQRRIAARPSQCVRYKRWDPDAVLWLRSDASAQPRPDTPASEGEALVGGGKGTAIVAGVPRCGLCGAPRAFEFQICPQLITKLSKPRSRPSQPADPSVSGAPERTAKDWMDADDDLDFATIAIFTCTRSCPIPTTPRFGAYTPEFAWIQLES
jgi:Programmed cell death protein 2, C-terminal putative domain